MTKRNTKSKCTRAKILLKKATAFVMAFLLALSVPIALPMPFGASVDLPFDSGVITVKAEYAVINKPMENAVMNWVNSEIKEGRTGIVGHEFEIGDCDEFRFFSAYVSNCHMVTACAILKCSPSGIKTDTTQESWLKIKSWLPIGTAQHPYRGTFSGLHKSGDDGIYRQKISGTFLIDGQGEYQGIFGYVAKDATVKYVEVDNDSTVTGSAVAYGGIAGVNYGTIDNCGVPGVKVSGYGSESYHATQVEACVGGIAGINYGTVKNCTVSGETLVLGPKNVGCFVGINYGTVSDCIRLNGAPDPLLNEHRQDLLMQNGICVGGIVGTNYGTVERCENQALVVGKEKVGGVVGANYNTVKECSNSGRIIGGTRVPEDVDEVVVGSQVGGVVGMNAAEGTIENSFHFRSDSWGEWPYEDLKEGYITATGASHVGCLVGQNEGKVENCYYVGNCNDEGTVFDCQVGEEKSQKKFASGEICYLLNNDVTDGSQAWYQDLTGEFVVGGKPLEYPCLEKTVGTVYASSPCAIYFSNHSEDEKITTVLPHEITLPWDKETHSVTCDTCHMTVRDKDTPEFDPTYKDIGNCETRFASPQS